MLLRGSPPAGWTDDEVEAAEEGDGAEDAGNNNQRDHRASAAFPVAVAVVIIVIVVLLVAISTNLKLTFILRLNHGEADISENKGGISS